MPFPFYRQQRETENQLFPSGPDRDGLALLQITLGSDVGLGSDQTGRQGWDHLRLRYASELVRAVEMIWRLLSIKVHPHSTPPNSLHLDG